MTSLTSVRAFDFSAKSEIKGKNKETELKAELKHQPAGHRGTGSYWEVIHGE